MGGGGGDTTNVTNTGLGDDQYQALADNQVGISGQITDSYADATKRYDAFDNRFTTLDGSVSGMATDLGTRFTDMNTAMANFDAANQDRSDSLSTGLGTNLSAIQGNTTALGTLSGDVTGGFDQMGTRFDTVDQANADVQNSVNTGFDNQATAFNELEGGINSQFEDTNAASEAGFAATGEALATGFDDTQTQLTNTQANVLQGQGQLASNLSDMSDTNDVYFGTLSSNQENLQAGQEGFQTSFDNYVDRYSDDTTLANQTRADLQKAQATGFDSTRSSIGTLGDSVSQGQNAIINQNQVLGSTIDEGFADNRTGQTSLARTFMNESGQIDTALVNQTRDLAGLAATQTDLDMKVRQNFQQIYNAFDNQGMLIENSIDANGNNIMREMDDSGFLMLRAMDAQGNDLGSKVIDINDSVRLLQSLTRQQGANMQMGQTSPASQMVAPVDGFASPFTTTR